MLRARCRALEDHRVHARQFSDRNWRRVVWHGRRICRAEQLYFRGFADPGFDPSPRRHRQPLGSGGGNHHRRRRSGETAGHPGISFPHLCRSGHHRVAVPPRGLAATSRTALLSGLAAMTALLETRNLTKTFGGVIALDGLDLAVSAGAIVGLIGPNGSGKTTFFNVVTGIYRADAGTIVFDGADITALAPPKIHRAGISRTFQRSRLSLPLSIFDNIMIGNHTRLTQSLWFNLMARGAFKRELQANYVAACRLLEVFEPRLIEQMFEPVAGLPMI